MARISDRVKNYASAKGNMHKMSLSDIYYKTVELRTVLKDISLQHRRWGREWYDFVEMSFFDYAKNALVARGSGEMVVETINRIDELEALEARMKELEKQIPNRGRSRV